MNYGLVSALVLSLLPLQAQVTEERAGAIEKIAAAAMAKSRMPGLSVGVLAGDGSMWTKAWGFSDLENFVPASPRTMFRLASLSKPFTAVAAMRLVEAGKLDLDAEVRRYVPSFPAKPWPVTTRQLLAHTAGIRHYAGDEINSTRYYPTVLSGLEIFANDPLVSEPGTKYLYTTYGFSLAGAAVESACGRSYLDCVKELVLEPAGMSHMRGDSTFALIPYRARGYQTRQDGEVENCGLADTSYKIPGGGWIADSEDLLKFSQALLQGRLLAPATLSRMWTSNLLKDGSSTGYGLGWGLNRRGGLMVAEHSGGQQGTSTFLMLAPERKLAIVVLTNLSNAPVRELAESLFDELTGGAN
jgi:CubicO group peptidase (beta-lactamase class C family)